MKCNNPNCFRPLTKEQLKYCSRSCAVTVNNKIPKRKSEISICENCQSTYSSRNRKFCSKTCRDESQRSDSWDAFIEGRLLKSEAIKKHLITLEGARCSLCGLTEWQGHPAPLVMDHINGNSSDNTLKNLRLVCGNCDMQLPTYKSKNKGNGRTYRRVKKQMAE